MIFSDTFGRSVSADEKKSACLLSRIIMTVQVTAAFQYTVPDTMPVKQSKLTHHLQAKKNRLVLPCIAAVLTLKALIDLLAEHAQYGHGHTAV